MKITSARSRDDDDLAATLKRLAGAEREATVALIVHLAEFDQRQLYRGAGFRSLFQYCVVVLRLSEDAASNRIAAARMTRRFPEVVDLLVGGSLSPTTVRLIAQHATPENGAALIEAATGKTKREVEELLARLFPEDDVRTSIRPLGPALSSSPVTGTAVSTSSGSAVRVDPQGPPLSADALPSVPIAAPPQPPPPDRFEIRFTAKADTVAKLRMVQDLLSHAVPDGDVAEVVDRALTVLAQDLLRKKFAVTNSPRKTVDSPSTADAPAAVQRAVYLRDRGRCTYVAKDGRRCDSRRFLQFDHILGRAVGGGFTVDNIRLRCGAHNRLEAERFYRTPPEARDSGGARVDLTRFPEFIRPETDTGATAT
jgi:hypothetical protein